jgi:hypothetical protein
VVHVDTWVDKLDYLFEEFGGDFWEGVAGWFADEGIEFFYVLHFVNGYERIYYNVGLGYSSIKYIVN